MDRDDYVIVIAICFLLLNSIIIYNQFELGKNIKEFYEVQDSVLENYIVRNVAGTGSMKPIINKDVSPNIKIVGKNISIGSPLYLGRVYIYKTINGSYIMHRLIGKYNISNEMYYIFLGDNNIIADDPIRREDIIEELVAINYNG
jgi:hypothetical protein